MKIVTMTDLTNAIEKLHSMGPKIVAVSSTDLNGKLTAVVSRAKGKYWMDGEEKSHRTYLTEPRKKSAQSIT